jgi:hypothetical protein
MIVTLAPRKMMEKYGPLPEGWKEMYDPVVGRHYFWCTRFESRSPPTVVETRQRPVFKRIFEPTEKLALS